MTEIEKEALEKYPIVGFPNRLPNDTNLEKRMAYIAGRTKSEEEKEALIKAIGDMMIALNHSSCGWNMDGHIEAAYATFKKLFKSHLNALKTPD